MTSADFKTVLLVTPGTRTSYTLSPVCWEHWLNYSSFGGKFSTFVEVMKASPDMAEHLKEEALPTLSEGAAGHAGTVIVDVCDPSGTDAVMELLKEQRLDAEVVHVHDERTSDVARRVLIAANHARPKPHVMLGAIGRDRSLSLLLSAALGSSMFRETRPQRDFVLTCPEIDWTSTSALYTAETNDYTPPKLGQAQKGTHPNDHGSRNVPLKRLKKNRAKAKAAKQARKRNRR